MNHEQLAGRKLKVANPHCIFTSFKLCQVLPFAFSLMIMNPFFPPIFGLILTSPSWLNSRGWDFMLGAKSVCCKNELHAGIELNAAQYVWVT